MSRIEGGKVPVSRSAGNNAPDNAGKGRPKREFSKVLAKKAADTEQAAPAPGAIRNAPPREFVIDAPKMAAPAAEPRLVQSLVQEIMVVTGPQGRQEVQIQFDSKTLDGLRVVVRRDDAGVELKFVARTQAVASVIQQHAGQLADALASRGVLVAGIQIQSPQQTVRAEAPSQSPRRDRQQQGQQGGRDRRR